MNARTASPPPSRSSCLEPLTTSTTATSIPANSWEYHYFSISKKSLNLSKIQTPTVNLQRKELESSTQSRNRTNQETQSETGTRKEIKTENPPSISTVACMHQTHQASPPPCELQRSCSVLPTTPFTSQKGSYGYCNTGVSGTAVLVAKWPHIRILTPKKLGLHPDLHQAHGLYLETEGLINLAIFLLSLT